MTRSRIVPLALLAIALLVGVGLPLAVVSARDVVVTYSSDPTTAAYRSGLDGGDPTDIDGDTTGSNISAITTGSSNGSPTVAVSARLSDSGATVRLVFVRGYFDGTDWTTQGKQEATATASTTYTADGLFVASDVFFTTAGSQEFKVLAEDPSSGTVTLYNTKTRTR